MALRGAIASLEQGSPFTVSRQVAETYVEGRVVDPPAPTTFQITASIQPVTGRDIRDLPEGQRADESITIYTTTPIRTRTAAGPPDVVTYRDEPWTVTRVEQFDAFGETHYRASAVRTRAP